jgi:polyribonucleotide nucleotidyltransferase
MYVVQREIDNQVLSIKTKDIAELADSSVLVQYGDTIVLVTVTVSKQINEEISFFPLVVEYRERAYAAGKIPGGFYKREGKPSEKEITTSRMIDRFIRPLFPSGFRNEIQIIALVLSSDTENESDILAMLGTSAALSISQIPFNGPVGIVRIGRINNKFIINPTNSELKESDLDIVLAGKEKKIVMIECSAKEVKEEDILAAISFGEGVIQATIEMQNELISLCGKKKEGAKNCSMQITILIN